MTRLNAKKVVETIVRQVHSGDLEKAVDFVLDLAAKGIIRDPDNDPAPTAPSGSIPVYKKSNKKKRHKKPGRKKGHPGASRKIPDKIDKHEEHKLEACPICGTPVTDPVASHVRYIEEIPPVQPVVTEHTIHRYWCTCCHKIVEPVFTEAMPGDNIGLRVYLFTAYLHYALGISVGNLVKILNQLFQFRLSPGALAKGWQRLAKLLQPEYDDIGERAKNSSLLHLDETGWRVNGITHWLWCFTNKDLCYYVIDKSRGSAVIKRVLGEIFRGTLISDFFSAYNKFQAWAKQKCLFHLFTELERVAARNYSPQWQRYRRALYSLLKQAVKLWKIQPDISKEHFQARRRSIEKQFDRLIKADYADDDCRRLCRRLQKHRQAIFTFLYQEGVSPYNNHAEQQMRKPVLARRICQQNRSQKGAETQAVLMSIFRIAELRGENAILYAEKLLKNQLRENVITKNKSQKAA